MVELGNIMGIEKDQGHDIKLSTLGPCDGCDDSNWRPLLIMKNPLSLSKTILFVEEVYNPCFVEYCVSLKAEQVNSTSIFVLFLFQAFKMVKV